MKSSIKNLFLCLGVALTQSWVLFALVAILGLIVPVQVVAQTFTTLHSFTGSDGSNSIDGLVLSSNTLYGTAEGGGSSGTGTVFKVNTDGTCFSNLYNFTATFGPNFTNSDGAVPSGVVLSGNTLFGTAQDGGSYGGGAVFEVNTDGTGFSNLPIFFFFDGDNGKNPNTVILSGNTLYGTTDYGNFQDNGTIFRINTDGTGFGTVHSFDPSVGSDGANPFGRLILSGDTLYGTTENGGFWDTGMVFAIKTNSSSISGFTNLHSFTAPFGFYGTNSDGAFPQTGLILSGNTLYGAASSGGSSGNGTIFAINIDGTGFTNLHSFTALSGISSGTNSDGAFPYSFPALILSGNTLYGTTGSGGPNGNGTVFAINTNGAGFTNLYSFAALTNGTNRDGASPIAGVILSNNTLYGETEYGGSSGNGTVFGLSFAPQLTIILSGANIILTWPTNMAGFDYSKFTLQFVTNLSPAAWCTNLPAPVVISGQYTVTNPVSGTQQFFRLIQ